MTAAGAPPFRLGPLLATHSGALVCGLFLLVGLGVLDDYGVWADEGGPRRRAQNHLRYLVSGDTTGLPTNHNQYYGLVFEVPALLVERLLGLTDRRHQLLTRHGLIHLVFLLGGLAGYVLAYRLFDNRVLAVFAMLMFLLHPRLYAHSFFNSKDIPFASLFLIVLLLIHRAFRTDTVAAFAGLGMGVGVATNLRIMGMVFVPVVVALRAGDWWVAASARRHIVRTTGAFVLASVGTLYGLSPYLWANPLRFGDALTTLAHHPNIIIQRFQGQLVSSDALPLHYVPTWFGITTPPVVLVLGLLGIGGVIYGALTRPGALVRETPERFGGLLVGCFVGPILAVMLVSAHMYSGWRHVYFLYAPFSLLAVYGLRGVSAGCRRRPLRAGVYGLALLGLGMVVVEMIRVHPYQSVYFNRLVDRTTPEYLRSQYFMTPKYTEYREGLEYLLERYPTGPLVVSTADGAHPVTWNRRILPRAARKRIVPAPGRSGFYLTNTSGPLRPGIYARQVYNNTILTVEKMMLSKEDADTAAYRAAHQATIATAPIIQAAFDIYLKDDMLVYVEEPCAAAEGPVFLHIHPVDVDDLPPHRVQYAFDNHDFYWNGSWGGDEGCMRIVHLPKYEIAWLATGQYNESGQVWRETVVFPKRPAGGGGSAVARVRTALEGTSPSREPH